MTDAELVLEARRVRDRAHAPYSRFQVGAAVLDASGRVYSGCNVENASYGVTICAERAALCRAVAEGASEIVAVAVIADTAGPVRPCGACRQFLVELAPKARVVMANLAGEVDVATAEELLPKRFRM
ncbi:MAG: cytidine deaminase [Planctomycetes bacterium]|nr:cytidine deaminase [Planctomycetota bacterium]